MGLQKRDENIVLPPWGSASFRMSHGMSHCLSITLWNAPMRYPTGCPILLQLLYGVSYSPSTLCDVPWDVPWAGPKHVVHLMGPYIGSSMGCPTASNNPMGCPVGRLNGCPIVFMIPWDVSSFQRISHGMNSIQRIVPWHVP